MTAEQMGVHGNQESEHVVSPERLIDGVGTLTWHIWELPEDIETLPIEDRTLLEAIFTPPITESTLGGWELQFDLKLETPLHLNMPFGSGFTYCGGELTSIVDEQGDTVTIGQSEETYRDRLAQFPESIIAMCKQWSESFKPPIDTTENLPGLTVGQVIVMTNEDSNRLTIVVNGWPDYIEDAEAFLSQQAAQLGQWAAASERG